MKRALISFQIRPHCIVPSPRFKPDPSSRDCLAPTHILCLLWPDPDMTTASGLVALQNPVLTRAMLVDVAAACSFFTWHLGVVNGLSVATSMFGTTSFFVINMFQCNGGT